MYSNADMVVLIKTHTQTHTNKLEQIDFDMRKK